MIELAMPAHNQLVNEAIADRIVALVLDASPMTICSRYTKPGADAPGHLVISIEVKPRLAAELDQLPQGGRDA
jgi:hypothetical protein